jgi:hypothetical protein
LEVSVKNGLRFLTSVGAVVFATLAISGPATAASDYLDMALGGGVRMNNGKSPGTSVDGELGLQVGGWAFLPLSEQLVLRTGFLFAQRHFKVGDATKTQVELDYVDIPATIMFKLADFGGIFAGANVGLNVADDCAGQDCAGVKSTIVPITFGGHFKVMPQVAVEVFYEVTSGKLADGLEDANAFGANLMFTFE